MVGKAGFSDRLTPAGVGEKHEKWENEDLKMLVRGSGALETFLNVISLWVELGTEEGWRRWRSPPRDYLNRSSDAVGEDIHVTQLLKQGLNICDLAWWGWGRTAKEEEAVCNTVFIQSRWAASIDKSWQAGALFFSGWPWGWCQVPHNAVRTERQPF